MGTRHLIKVTSEGKLKVAQYGQFNGHPYATGLEILHYLEVLDHDLLKRSLAECTFRDLNYKEATQQNARIGALILPIIERSIGCVLEDYRNFEGGVMCAYIYEIDLDAGIFTVKEGGPEPKPMGSFVIKDLPTPAEFLVQLGYDETYLDNLLTPAWRDAA